LGLLLQDGKTPLHKAAEHFHNELVGVLLGVGAAVDATDKVRPCYMVG
jgi:ankyrin repeat protein